VFGLAALAPGVFPVSLLSLFKRKPAAPPPPDSKPRRCLPTQVTKERLILSKAAAELRYTDEIRLAQQLATAKGLKFTLAVRPSSQRAPALAAHLRQHGADISEAPMADYTVYVACAGSDGQERDGWVLGNSTSLSGLKQSTRSLWLRDRLRIGATFSGDDLVELEKALSRDTYRARNIDDEDVREALLSLAANAKACGGTIFIQ
jgi:hypothetical protein